MNWNTKHKRLSFSKRLFVTSLLFAKFVFAENFDGELVKNELSDHYNTLMREIQAEDRFRNDPYLNLGLAVVEKYIGRLDSKELETLQTGGWRSLQINDLKRILDAMDSDLNDSKRQIGRYTSGGSFDKIKSADYPFKCGFGHFHQIVEDRALLGRMGFSITQQSSSSAVAPVSDIDSLSSNASQVRRNIEQLYAAGIFTDVLLGFDDKTITEVFSAEEQPLLMNPVDTGAIVAIKYNIHSPTVRHLFEMWITNSVKRISGAAGLYSACLANEPTYAYSGRDDLSRPLWSQYLKFTHETLEALNRRYGTNFSAWDEVPVPELGPPAEGIAARALPVSVAERIRYYDWIRFNQEEVAKWHKSLNDWVKAADPALRTHSKIMSFFVFDQSRVHLGIDPEAICDVTDMAGCDEYTFLQDGYEDVQKDIGTRNGNGYQWPLAEMSYELLYSIKGQRVFNSENHIIPDNSAARPLPSNYMYAALWQGAIHHLTDNVYWVWEEHNDTDALRGSLYFRPWNVYQLARANLDINRLFSEVEAIKNQTRKVAFLYSPVSVFWDASYGKSLVEAYMALSTSGVPITFVTDRKIQEGRLGDVKTIILPSVEHLNAKTHQALKAFVSSGGRLIGVDSGYPERNEYNEKLSDTDEGLPLKVVLRDNKESLAEALKTSIGGDATIPFQIKEAATGRPLSGTQFYVATSNRGGWTVYLNNLTKSPVDVAIDFNGDAVNLINHDFVDLSSFSLQPLTPMMLSVSPKRQGIGP